MALPTVRFTQFQALLDTNDSRAKAPYLFALGADGLIYWFNWIDKEWQHVEKGLD